MAAQTNSTDLFDAYFRRADLDGDGRISGPEAVAFFRGSNLPQNVLAKVWSLANHNGADFLGRAEFYNALKLVTVAQTKRELTPDIVKAALFGPASSKIPAPQINLAVMPSSQLNSNTAATATQLGSAAPPASQIMPARNPQVLARSSMNQPVSHQQNLSTRPSQGTSLGIASNLQQAASSHGISGGGYVAGPRPHNSNTSTNGLGEKMVGTTAGVTSQNLNSETSPSISRDGFGFGFSELAPSSQPKSLETTLPIVSQDPMSSFQVASKDSKVPVASGNGFVSNSAFGDVSHGLHAQPNQESLSRPHFAASLPTSSAIIPVSSDSQSLVRPTQPDSLRSSFTSPEPVGGERQKVQSTLNQNQQVPVQSTTAYTSTGFPMGARDSSSSQSLHQWPRMTQSDVQKYKKVFWEVDTDRDGKISGDQARNLFLSWRLPREILKQVWDLSDQDNDSMLSLREFCIALYLMERYREGHPLPAVLPSNIMFDETLVRPTGQPTAAYGSEVWRPPHGLQQAQGVALTTPITPAAGLRLTQESSVSPAESTRQPSPPKSRVPVLEKHLVDQLSTEEQSSLNSKFKEATEADKKVEELEKEILDSKQKIEFFRTKMQELILYKSKCDNRLNEIIERTSADKHEVDSLMKKYEERYKQVGDVASKLTTEEATFRDIQEKKMELYQAIVKMEQAGSADDTFQARADHIQSDLEHLVKSLNERCKKYGLRAKPTTLVELPFGWQPGIGEGAADWDADWDKLEDEGFTFVKELTLDVQNIIAPPKVSSSLVQKGATSADKSLSAAASVSADSKSEKLSTTGEQMPENGAADASSKDSLVRSPLDSPSERSVLGSPSQEWRDSQTPKSIEADGSPLIGDTQSDHGGTESVVSGDKSFDEPSWGAFDTQYDTDSVWGFNPTGPKDVDQDRHSEHSFFDSGPLGLNPIRTNSMLQVDEMFQKKSPFTFADSVPSTPVRHSYSGNSPSRYSEMSEDQSFNNFSRFDSFSMKDSGFFPPSDSFARFDSIRSSQESSDHGRGGFPSFDDADPFGTTGLFKTVGQQNPDERRFS